ncbi:von Willebrand factor A domain-containing protein 8 [Phytophthora pseudosyringae]|uniref:von Willebrand factor A domain-containing protein 8 n=1 Tax=Phytophthora pseudosyringae TaxID=221518 RepID=A0A8T1V2S8_9STRA|nr:von Willebrand factor A domain-containing protein 8 [Phytophthora pseudosyringae]
MNASVLCPPNSQLLSDGVVREVVQRTKPASSLHQLHGPYKGFSQSSLHPATELQKLLARDTYSTTPSASTTSVAVEQVSPKNVKRKRLEQMNRLNLKRLGTGDSNEGDHRPTAGSNSSANQHMKILELIKLGQYSERKRRRDNQRRYRQKQKDVTASLEETNQLLREEIEQLELRRCDILTHDNVWTATIDYFRVFRQGLRMGQPQLSNQFKFLQAAMAPDVLYNTGRGPKGILSSWGIWQWFDDVEVELEGLRVRAGGSLVASTATSATITERTLRNAFPHLWRSEVENRATTPQLASRLLSQHIVVRGSTTFEWDSARGCVVRMACQSDFLTPMLRLLGSLELVAHAFEKSRITPDFQQR